MTPFRNDETNPFARQSPWPGMPQTVLRPTTTPAAAGTPVPAEGAPATAQPEPEPAPQPVTLIRTPIPQLEDSPAQAGPVAAAPMFMASPAARPVAEPEPVIAAEPAAPVSPPRAAPPAPPQPVYSPVLDPAERLPKFRPLDEEETRIVRRAPQARSFNPELYDVDIFASEDAPPLVSPIGAQRTRRKPERPGRRELRLTPLLAAAAVGAGGTAALFLMVGLGRESALTAPKDSASSLAAGQLVGEAPPPALRAAIPSEPPAALTAMTTPAAEPAKPAAPRLAMARIARAPAAVSRAPASAAAAEPAHIDIPSPPPAATELAPAPTPSAAPAQAAPLPAAPFVRPPAPDAQAPISRHVPDPS
ncbi:MAG TPA: hypothetical protein VIE16_12320 [Phenylobacterium sp.]|jgi:hypothetical protein